MEVRVKSTEAQLRAKRVYAEKNKGKARLPGSFLNDETAKKLEQLAIIMGTKMAAIEAAIDLLHKEKIKDGSRE